MCEKVQINVVATGVLIFSVKYNTLFMFSLYNSPHLIFPHAGNRGGKVPGGRRRSDVLQQSLHVFQQP